jgi:serine-type D-Ala-D-Ala carboxypeptidase/endopeptidase
MKQTIIFLLITFINCKPDKYDKLSQKTIEKVVNEDLSNFIKSPYTAVSGAVYVNGKTYQFHFGKLTDGKKATNQTIYEIASITKTYTGLILSQAVYDKRLCLDADIRTYLDDIYSNLELNDNKPITLRHSITHTSGIPMNINCKNKNTTIEEQLSCFDEFTTNTFHKAHHKLNSRNFGFYTFF